MYEEIYTLDNTTSGIVAVKPGTDEIIKLDNNCNDKSMFRNKNLLEAALRRSNINNYDLGFILDGNFIPYSKVQQINYDLFQVFIDDKIVDIIPTFRDKVFKAGYFSFTDDPNGRLDYKEGRELNKALHNIVKTSAAYLLKNGTFKNSCVDASLTNITSGISPMKYEVYNNTTTMRIMRGFELVKVNESRKYFGEKVLPFMSDKDKYKNIYFCFTRDINEFKNDKEYQETADDIIVNMLSYIQTYYAEFNPKINMINFYLLIQL